MTLESFEQPQEGDEKGGASTAIVIASFILFAGIGLTLSDRDVSASPVALRVDLRSDHAFADAFSDASSVRTDVLAQVDRITVRAWRRGIRAAKRAWL